MEENFKTNNFDKFIKHVPSELFHVNIVKEYTWKGVPIKKREPLHYSSCSFFKKYILCYIGTTLYIYIHLYIYFLREIEITGTNETEVEKKCDKKRMKR